MGPNVCRKTSEDHFFGSHTKETVGKVARQHFGNVWAKIFCNPKNFLAPTPMKRKFAAVKLVQATPHDDVNQVGV